MSTSDALQDPVATPLPTRSATAEVVGRWWASTAPGMRTALLRADGAEALPRSVAAELAHLGVACPLALVPEHGRLVRRALAPAELVELLTRHRPPSTATSTAG